MKTNWRDWLKTVGVFAVFGPPLGWTMMSIAAIVVSVFANESHARDIGYMFVGIFFGWIFSYLLGLIPALLTGMIVGLVRHRLRPWWAWCGSAAIGFVVTGVYFLIFDFNRSGQWEWDMFVTPFNYMGAASAFVCAWLARPKISAVPPPLPDHPIKEIP